jgi:hypothetical protein
MAPGGGIRGNEFMSRPDLAPGGQATVRTVPNALTDMAAGLPLGLDSRMEFGVCDGLNLQLLDNSDLISYRKKAPAGGEEAGTLSVLLRAHTTERLRGNY